MNYRTTISLMLVMIVSSSYVIDACIPIACEPIDNEQCVKSGGAIQTRPITGNCCPKCYHPCDGAKCGHIITKDDCKQHQVFIPADPKNHICCNSCQPIIE
ncbi:hypothetical protein PPL_09728 [Heterostelium album PN500]|uniref:Uncharacterized protein n=1 Tax=Heterostelium pallidum (strain ATCC 26659 / Pp 5 / PN500) TaxID=670386 RepID=D3BNM5_HETP5|nr:hypothetical protein PPL_09728 [Heterostelium album PN500]EFA76976.1 hypothetical protein PPL_09728 [Heterostelium album PN500]|eukprot:XP_020429107.1 hypothetical protein PPL_09728 [Heterostelium album PN500]